MYLINCRRVESSPVYTVRDPNANSNLVTKLPLEVKYLVLAEALNSLDPQLGCFRSPNLAATMKVQEYFLRRKWASQYPQLVADL